MEFKTPYDEWAAKKEAEETFAKLDDRQWVLTEEGERSLRMEERLKDRLNI